MSDGQLKEKQQTEICLECGKPRGRRGSLTFWIFGSGLCQCYRGQPKAQASASAAPTKSPTTDDHALELVEVAAQEERLVATEEREPDYEELVGQTICGHYRVLSIIGVGGMSVVYKAKHLDLDMLAAIKIVSPERRFDRRAADRFRQEARAACSLSHENIVAAREFSVDESGRAYLIMDLVEGDSLDDCIQKHGRLSSATVLEIATDVARGLAYAHSAGIIHRDIKSGNIMICKKRDGTSTCKIADFGIAKALFGYGEQPSLTETGDIFGSPAYMSPEQCRGQEVDARCDIYSLGCVMYEALSGQVPFPGDVAVEVIVRHVSEVAKPLSSLLPRGDMSRGMGAVVAHCLEKDPDRRYQSAAALLKDLELIRHSQEPSLPVGEQKQQKVRLIDQLTAHIVDAFVVSIISTVLWVPVYYILSHLVIGPVVRRLELPDLSFGWYIGMTEGLVPGLPLILMIAQVLIFHSLTMNWLVLTGAGPFAAQLVVPLIVLFDGLYRVVMESANRSSTLGQLLAGYCVRDTSGFPIDLRTAARRHIAKGTTAVAVLLVIPVTAMVLATMVRHKTGVTDAFRLLTEKYNRSQECVLVPIPGTHRSARYRNLLRTTSIMVLVLFLATATQQIAAKTSAELLSNALSSYLISGQKAIDRGNFKEAVSDMSNSLDAYLAITKSSKIWNSQTTNEQLGMRYGLRGYSYCMLGQFAQAIPDLTKAIELRPLYVQNYTNRATAYRKLGRRDLAALDDKREFVVRLVRDLTNSDPNTYLTSLEDLEKMLSPSAAQTLRDLKALPKNADEAQTNALRLERLRVKERQVHAMDISIDKPDASGNTAVDVRGEMTTEADLSEALKYSPEQSVVSNKARFHFRFAMRWSPDTRDFTVIRFDSFSDDIPVEPSAP